jgi:metallophosphoesterase (TIGR00282 family)
MKLRILLLGDIVGAPGRAMVAKHIDALKRTYRVDACILNGENSASSGRGITPTIAKFFFDNEVDVITTGNHVWAQKEIIPYIATSKNLLRPINFPADCPGTGVTTFTCKGYHVGVINVQGRVFMKEYLSCPLRACDSAITYLKPKTSVILVDMHAEATAEKAALAYYLDGRVSAVVGTHTHVQTNDARLLPQRTAFITDLGMAGALDSAIGVQAPVIIQQTLSQMPVKFVLETKGPFVLSGACVEIDVQSGRATEIIAVRVIDEAINLTGFTD